MRADGYAAAGPILIAEPEPGRRSLYAKALGDAGYEVVFAEPAAVTAEAARTGAALVVARPPDVGESVRTGRAFRTQDETRDTPLLVLTGFDDAYTREQIVRSGATAVLIDPPRVELLLRQVKRLLCRRAERLEPRPASCAGARTDVPLTSAR